MHTIDSIIKSTHTHKTITYSNVKCMFTIARWRQVDVMNETIEAMTFCNRNNKTGSRSAHTAQPYYDLTRGSFRIHRRILFADDFLQTAIERQYEELADLQISIVGQKW